MALDPKVKSAIVKMMSEGYSYRAIAKKLNVSLSSVQRVINDSRNKTTKDASGITNPIERKRVEELQGPVDLDKLSEEAARALEDLSLIHI